VRAVVSTNALELGIDIGALDTAIMAGYPGTIAATWQRAGRAGRRSGRSAAIMVASSAPIDQFVVRHPSYFFDASPEHALVNPDNLHILLDHIKCAAFELPFSADERFGREDVQEVLGVLGEEGFVHRAGTPDGKDEWNWTSESYPADAVSLRSVSSDNFVVVDTTHGSNVIGILGVARDVTDERDRAVALERSEARYTRLVESASDAIFTVGPNGIVTALNRSLERAVLEARVGAGEDEDLRAARTPEEQVDRRRLALAGGLNDDHDTGIFRGDFTESGAAMSTVSRLSVVQYSSPSSAVR
jgi:ATP-dependent helicase YprA (DUF1998 family)